MYFVFILQTLDTAGCALPITFSLVLFCSSLTSNYISVLFKVSNPIDNKEIHMNIVIVSGIVIAAFLWRVLFWKYFTRKKANKSWTLIPSWRIRDFLNSSAFVIGLLWLSTYFLFLKNDPLTYRTAADLLIGLKIFMLAVSLFYPTIGVTLDLKYQVTKEMRD